MLILLSLLILISLGFLYLLNRFSAGQKRIEEHWKEGNVQPFENPDKSKKLEIVPLIDWHTKSSDFMGEAGVSYLIRTDKAEILFDVGLNQAQSNPSSLLQNMNKLKLSTHDFDHIFISHNHLDHVGGMKYQKKNTFNLGDENINLDNKKILTPIPMHYKGKSTHCESSPYKIAKGVYSIGVIQNFDFFMGQIDEQAIAVNVEGKGILIIVGCGHQGLQKIIERTEALFEEPIYGIVGGLHYPVTDSRLKIAGIKMQKYFGICREPWNPYTLEDVRENIAFLKKRKPKLVSVSSHDSCDASLDAFREAFPKEYDELLVGKKITIGM
jgi:7,8-dihydropterin-6-yl-methyl-4-(beta-D-ribofuranosyl)aminobenzene 5'-phosphate synthase